MRALGVVILLAFVPHAAADEPEAQPQSYWMVHPYEDEAGWHYAPAQLDATPGAEVVLMVFGNASHTMTSEGGAWPEAVATPQDGIGETTFAAPSRAGTYPFRCAYHPEMTGTLVVHGSTAGKGDAPTPGPGFVLVLVPLGMVALAWRRR